MVCGLDDPINKTRCVCVCVCVTSACCYCLQCPIEWFHFQCVGLAAKPKGKWYVNYLHRSIYGTIYISLCANGSINTVTLVN